MVSVCFFGALRELVGKKGKSLEFTDDREVTVETVLRRLTELHGKDFIDYVFDEKTGKVQSYLLLLVNGRTLTAFDGLETRLVDGDVLAMLPPVGGG